MRRISFKQVAVLVLGSSFLVVAWFELPVILVRLFNSPTCTDGGLMTQEAFAHQTPCQCSGIQRVMSDERAVDAGIVYVCMGRFI
jgi:hypothetical protein